MTLPITTILIGLVGSVLVLTWSARILIKALTNISLLLKLSEFTVGFVLMAIATSLPELFVGLTAALANQAQLALGTALGSNITNLTIIVGLTAVLAGGLKLSRKTLKEGMSFSLILSVIPVLLALDLTLSRFDGFALLTVFFLYTALIIGRRKLLDTEVKNNQPSQGFFKALGMLFVGVVLMILSAQAVVGFATSLAIGINIPILFIGIILVAMGTSLPELMFGIQAVKDKHESMGWGNIMGSVVANASLILGLSAIIQPIKIQSFYLMGSIAIFTVIVLILFFLFTRTKEKITVKEGIVLIALYVIFVLVTQAGV